MADRLKTDFIVVHCSATDDDIDIGVEEIRRWHVDQGWADIGYHYVIRRDGRIETGRRKGQKGAHVKGYNSVSVGICLVGGVDANDGDKARDNFTVEQKETLRKLLLLLRGDYQKARIQGHRDFPNVNKACPSFDVGAWLRTVNINQEA